MYKILKNFKPNIQSNKIEYVLFDTKNHNKTKILLEPIQAIELSQIYDMTNIAPVNAQFEGLFNYTDTSLNDFGLTNFVHPDMVDKIYPPFSEKRKEVRKRWNKQESYKNWDKFLMYNAYMELQPDLNF